MRCAWLLAVTTVWLAGCGSTVITHTVAVARKPHVMPTDMTPAPHVGTGPPTGAGTNDCGTIDGESVYGDAATSCGFARNVYRAAEAFYRTVGADAAHLHAYSPATGKTYRLDCEINSADQANCSTSTGAMVSFQAFTTPPMSPAATNSAPTPSAQGQDFSGNGSTTLAPITIPDSDLSWTDDGGLFQILTDGINVNSQGSSGSTFVSAGTYAIEVNAMGNWTINITPGG